KEPKGGGVTMSYALQTSVLSLAQLRRLRFPTADGQRDAQRDAAARTVLAALGLAAVALSRQSGCDLRSRCVLVPADDDSRLELVANASDVQALRLSADDAL